jgi:hypothetical protein
MELAKARVSREKSLDASRPSTKTVSSPSANPKERWETLRAASKSRQSERMVKTQKNENSNNKKKNNNNNSQLQSEAPSASMIETFAGDDIEFVEIASVTIERDTEQTPREFDAAPSVETTELCTSTIETLSSGEEKTKASTADDFDGSGKPNAEAK